MNKAATIPRAYRPMSRQQIRRRLEETREELAIAQHYLNRAYGFTTDVWQATQTDEAPTYVPPRRNDQ